MWPSSHRSVVVDMNRIELTERDFSIDEVCGALRTDGTGAIVTFLGVVRGAVERRVISLEFEAYREMAISEMEKLREEAIQRFGLEDLAIIHRLGTLDAGESIVLIAAVGGHRDECFKAARFTIDKLKDLVPIWKKEIFEDGEEWVEVRH